MQGRSLPQPDRTWALAQAGAVLVRLGRAEAGRKLIDEAAGDAARLGSRGPRGLCPRLCGPGAGALRPGARPEARRAVPLPPTSTTVTPGSWPSRSPRPTPIAPSPWPTTMHGRSTMPDMVRTEVAYRIGAEQPDRAVRIIEGMKTFGAAKMQAEAFAWLAVAVAPRDRARAVALIDRALAMPIDQPREFQTWINSGGALAASAHIAAAARHAGYPDMDGAILRVMAVRTSPGGSFFDPAMEIQAAAMAAVPLALVDPGAARVLLEQIEARGGLDPARLAEVGGYDWLRAWGLVDLEKAGALRRRPARRAREDPGRRPGQRPDLPDDRHPRHPARPPRGQGLRCGRAELAAGVPVLIGAPRQTRGIYETEGPGMDDAESKTRDLLAGHSASTDPRALDIGRSSSRRKIRPARDRLASPGIRYRCPRCRCHNGGNLGIRFTIRKAGRPSSWPGTDHEPASGRPRSAIVTFARRSGLPTSFAPDTDSLTRGRRGITPRRRTPPPSGLEDE